MAGRLTWLAEVLEAANLPVKRHPGWETRGALWSPVGGMTHHTAPPVPFPVDSLAGVSDGRIKCNLNIKPDGTLWVIAAGACNYSSGRGSSVVLNETRDSIPPSESARVRGLKDDIGGNSHYINVEVDHLGDGSPLELEAYATLVGMWGAINEHLSWRPAKLISHGEWTSRKIDPRWNGADDHDNMVAIRGDVGRLLEGPPLTGGKRVNYLAIGDTGSAVTRCQRWMARSPQADNLAELLEDLTEGVYDAAMADAVTEYQRRRNLAATGTVDGMTYADLTLWKA